MRTCLAPGSDNATATSTHALQHMYLHGCRSLVWPADFSYLWLTGDNFVGKLSATRQPTRPTQPSVLSESVNE